MTGLVGFVNDPRGKVAGPNAQLVFVDGRAFDEYGLQLKLLKQAC